MGFLIPTHPLTNFEIQKNYKNEPRFNSVFSKTSLPKSNFIEYYSIKKIKDRAYIINLDEYANVGLLYFVKKNEIIYFDSFGVEYVPEEIK